MDPGGIAVLSEFLIVSCSLPAMFSIPVDIECERAPRATVDMRVKCTRSEMVRQA